MGGEFVGSRPGVSQTNGLREQPSASGRKGQRQKNSGKHAASMIGIVKRWVVWPERCIEHPVRDLSLRIQQKSSAIVDAIRISFEIQISECCWIVELNAGNLAGEMAHIVAAERPVDAAEMSSVLLLEVEQEPGRFHTASRQNDLFRSDSALPPWRGNLKTLHRLPIAGETDSSHRAAQADLN